MKEQLYSDSLVTTWLAILDIVARDLSRVQYGTISIELPLGAFATFLRSTYS